MCADDVWSAISFNSTIHSFIYFVFCSLNIANVCVCLHSELRYLTQSRMTQMTNRSTECLIVGGVAAATDGGGDKSIQEMLQLLLSLVFPFSRSTCSNIEWNMSATDWRRKSRIHKKKRENFINPVNSIQTAIVSRIVPHFVWPMSLRTWLAMIQPIFCLPPWSRHALDANQFYCPLIQQVH